MDCSNWTGRSHSSNRPSRAISPSFYAQAPGTSVQPGHRWRLSAPPYLPDWNPRRRLEQHHHLLTSLCLISDMELRLPAISRLLRSPDAAVCSARWPGRSGRTAAVGGWTQMSGKGREEIVEMLLISIPISCCIALSFSPRSFLATSGRHALYLTFTLTTSHSFLRSGLHFDPEEDAVPIGRKKEPDPRKSQLASKSSQSTATGISNANFLSHGSLAPQTTNDTHDEAFGYPGGNWHGDRPAVLIMRREA